MKNTILQHLHTYPDGGKANEYVLKTSHGLVTVDPEGGYVTSWKVMNQKNQQMMDVLYRGSTKKRSGIPILFPYFGKSTRTRQHGFGRDSMWHISHADNTSIRMSLTSKDISADAKNEYPYVFSAELVVYLHEQGALDYILHIENHDEKELPISPGIHPYWDIEQEDKKKIKAPQLTDFDASSIDWDTNPPDDRFAFEKHVELYFPDRKITIEDISSNHPKIKMVAVWSQSIENPDYIFFFFEPICGGDYAIDNSPILIPAKEIWEMKLKFSVEF